MKLAFIETGDRVFVTSEDKREELVNELKIEGYYITNVTVAPLGSAICIGASIKSFGEKEVEVDF
jgi:hypothetical protein